MGRGPWVGGLPVEEGAQELAQQLYARVVQKGRGRARRSMPPTSASTPCHVSTHQRGACTFYMREGFLGWGVGVLRGAW